MEAFNRPSTFWTKYAMVCFMLAWMGLGAAVTTLLWKKGNPPDWVLVVYLIGGFFAFIQVMKLVIRNTYKS